MVFCLCACYAGLISRPLRICLYSLTQVDSFGSKPRQYVLKTVASGNRIAIPRCCLGISILMADYGIVINAPYMVLTMFDFWLFIVTLIR
jgi:hypothetical protein